MSQLFKFLLKFLITYLIFRVVDFIFFVASKAESKFHH